jgi:CBS domain
MRVAELMVADLFVVHASTSVADALHRAWERNVHHVLVTDQRRLVGVVCTCDLEAAELDRAIATVIKRPPEIIWPESSLREAAERFVRKSVGCLPVCDGGELVGVITRADILRSALPEHELPGGFCCVFCADTRHVRPLRGQPGLGVCLDCRSRGFSLSVYDSPFGPEPSAPQVGSAAHTGPQKQVI